LFLSAATLLAQQSPVAPADALLEAARTGDRARVAALLDSGVPINSLSRYGISALGFAAEGGHFDIVRLLVERNADVNVADSFYGSRPLDMALRNSRLDIALFCSSTAHRAP
jgi:ankyrin repeat protein